MKKVLEKLKGSVGGVLIALLLSLMLAFYEPLNMYTGNLEDFWFSLSDFLPIIAMQFGIMFVAISLFYIIVNCISRKAYKSALVVGFIVTLATYIQGNFLAYNLPGLAGNQINWSEYKIDQIISVILWVVVIAGSLFALKKLKFEKFEKAVRWISVAIIVMISVATVSLLAKPNVFDKKGTEVTKFDNFNNISKDKNFIIFLVDQVDSRTFNSELSKNWDKREIFKDFTYYPDTTSTYFWTIFSVPYILTGEWWENDKPQFSDYFTSAIDNSILFSELEKEGYKMNLYEDEELLNYKGENLSRFDNIKSDVIIKKKELVKQEMKYVLFRYLPYQLKPIAKIENLDLNRTKESSGGELYSSLNDIVYDYIKEDLNVVDDKYFSFIHVVGAHPPFVYDEELVRHTEEGTYEDGVNASISIVNEYLKRLRENDMYDNSVIIVMSDHGNGEKETTIDRSNPILYIKGINEKHDYEKSNKKISYANLNDAYMQLLKGDTSDKLFENLDNSKRRLIYSEIYNPELTEMVQTGNAWDTETLVETGTKYLRE